MARPRTVLIAGGGLGGLTAALALVRRGFRVRVFERATELREVGAGLTLAPTAMRVFADLGLWDEVSAATCRADKVAFVHYATGALIHGEVDPHWNRRPDTPEQGGHAYRSRIHALLADALHRVDPDSLSLGREATGVEVDADAARLRFADGSVAEGDLLIGADGLRSMVHPALLGEAPAAFTGVAAVRCLIPRTPRVERFLSQGRAANYVGVGRNFHRYGLEDGTVINCVGLAQAGEWREEGWTVPFSRQAFLDLYEGFHPDVRGLIEHAPEGGIYRWALFAREPLPAWSRGRGTLLGDAAHPMLPYLGQGATAAIEDALVLARALESHDDMDEGLAAYEADRRPRTAEQMRMSRLQGERLNLGPEAYGASRPDQAALSRYDPRRAAV